MIRPLCRFQVFVPVFAVRVVLFACIYQAAGHDLAVVRAQTEPALGLPVLPTVSVREGRAMGFNQRMIDESRQLRLRQGISVLDSGYWLLDFTFKPLRWQTIDVSGGGGRDVLCLNYRVVNRTGKPRLLAPRFILVADGDPPKEESILPRAVKTLQEREDPSIRLLGAVSVMGAIPPSIEEGTDLAVFGVALWEGVSSRARNFHLYVQGLSNSYQPATPLRAVAPIVRYKTLRIDFVRRGKAFVTPNPPYEWVYK